MDTSVAGPSAGAGAGGADGTAPARPREDDDGVHLSPAGVRVCLGAFPRCGARASQPSQKRAMAGLPTATPAPRERIARAAAADAIQENEHEAGDGTGKDARERNGSRAPNSNAADSRRTTAAPNPRINSARVPAPLVYKLLVQSRTTSERKGAYDKVYIERRNFLSLSLLLVFLALRHQGSRLP